MMSFFGMGGYGSYIWPSYGITFAALIWLFFTSWQRTKKAAKELRDMDSPTPD